MGRAYKLTAEHAPLVAEMHASYPAGLRMDTAALREKLGLLERSRYSFSWALIDDAGIVAYIIAYPSKSFSSGDFVVIIDDFQVRAGHTKGQSTEFYRLLKLMAEEKEQAQLGHLHIEALCRREAYRVVAAHPTVIERLGYELLGSYEYWEDSLGEEMCLMRWSPIPGANIGKSRDSLVFSQDLLEELELSG